jgi:hypothetical protein
VLVIFGQILGQFFGSWAGRVRRIVDFHDYAQVGRRPCNPPVLFERDCSPSIAS